MFSAIKLKLFVFVFALPVLLSGQFEDTQMASGEPNSGNTYYEKMCLKAMDHKDWGALNEYAREWYNAEKCEPAERILMLLDIHQGTFDVKKYDHIIKNLCIYKALENGYMYTDTVFYLPYKKITGYPRLSEEFNQKTRELAEFVKNKGDFNADAHCLLTFYAANSDSLYRQIQHGPMMSEELRNAYLTFVEQEIRDSFYVKFGLLTGYWMPSGNAGVLGNHPSAGFQMGGVTANGWGVSLSMMQRYGQFTDSVLIHFDDELLNAKSYLGGFYGLDVSKSMFANLKNELDVSAGIALDGFLTTHDFPAEGLYVEKYVNSFNVNVGITYRYIIRLSYYVECQFKYHFINYENTGGTNLEGNAISLTLGLGFFSGGKTRRDILRYLDYKY